MKVKKAQAGIAKKKAVVDSVDSEMFPGKKVAIKDIRRGPYISETKKTVVKKKMKDGGKSFPDLNKDGKITKADILKGRGVIKNGGNLKKAKSGASLSPSSSNVSLSLGGYKKVIGKNYGKAKSGAALKKQAATAIAMKKAGKSPKKAMGGMKMMKGGGKCKYGC